MIKPLAKYLDTTPEEKREFRPKKGSKAGDDQ